MQKFPLSFVEFRDKVRPIRVLGDDRELAVQELLIDWGNHLDVFLEKNLK